MANRGRKENDEIRAFVLANWRDMTDGRMAEELFDRADKKAGSIKIKQIRKRLGLRRPLRDWGTYAERARDAELKRDAIEKRREQRVLDQMKRTGLYDVKD